MMVRLTYEFDCRETMKNKEEKPHVTEMHYLSGCVQLQEQNLEGWCKPTDSCSSRKSRNIAEIVWTPAQNP